MSGGHFDYQEYGINEIIEEIDRLIDKNQIITSGGYVDDINFDFSLKTIIRFKQASHCLKQAQKMVRRIDYLVCGDDSEETFDKKWDEEIDNCNLFHF